MQEKLDELLEQTAEMFWNNPAGAEGILQIRSGALSVDDRLVRLLSKRPGYPFLRRSTLTDLSA